MTETQSGSFGSLLGRGILMLLLGILILVFPVFAGLFTSVMTSILLIMLGIAIISYGCTLVGKAAKPWAKILLIILGVIVFVLGIISFIMPLETLIALTLIIAVGFFINGVAELGIAIFGGVPTAARVLAGITGVLGIILGVLFILQPFSSFVILLTVTGVFLFVFGLFAIIEALIFRNTS